MALINWLKMLAVAEQIMALAPWKTHFEDDVFAIQPRKDGPVYFVSVMGSGGEHFAIAYYPGLDGLSLFRKSQSPEISDEERMEAILFNGHLQLSFEQKKFLMPEDLEIFKAFGKRYKGKWPVFRSHRAARVPWGVSAEEAADLLVLMEQTLNVLQRGDEGLLRPCDEEEFFMRTWDGADSICRVADLPKRTHLIQAILPAGALDGLKKTSSVLEVDIVPLPTPIEDVPPGEPPYLPLMFLVVDSESGLVLGMDIIPTRDGVEAAFAAVPGSLTKILRKAELIPESIVGRHLTLLSMLEVFESAYGIRREFDEDLDALDEALSALMEAMGGMP